MALVATKGEIPKNAVVLDRKSALEYQWNQVTHWANQSEVWPFRYGIIGLAAIASVTGLHINNRYRIKFKLRDYGFVATAFPTVVGPAMFAAAFHTQLISEDILLNETKCPLCLQYKATIIQVATSVVYPVIICPVINSLFVLRHATYQIPYWTDVRGTLSLWWKFTKPLGKTLLAFSCFHAVAASYVTYAEGEKLYKLQLELLKHPEKRYQKGQ